MEWRERSPHHVACDASSNEQEDEQEALYRARIAAALGGDETPALHHDDGFMEPIASQETGNGRDSSSRRASGNTHAAHSLTDALSQWDVGELSVLRSAVRSPSAQLWHTVRYHLKKVENGASGKDIVEWIMRSGFLAVAAQHEFKYGAEMSAALAPETAAREKKQKKKKETAQDRELAVSFADAMLQRGMFFQLNRRDTFTAFRGTSAQLYVRDDPRSLFLGGQVDQPVWKQLTQKSKFEERLRQLLAGTVGVHESESKQMKTVYVEEYQIYDGDAKRFVGKGSGVKLSVAAKDSPAESHKENSTFQEVLAEIAIPPVLGEEAEHCEWVIGWEKCVVSSKTDSEGWVYGSTYADVLSALLSFSGVPDKGAARADGTEGKTDPNTPLSAAVSPSFDAKRNTCRLRLWKRPARVRPQRRESVMAMVLDSRSHAVEDFESPGRVQSYGIPIGAQNGTVGRRGEANDVIGARPAAESDFLRSQSLPNAHHKNVAFTVGTYSPGGLIRHPNDLPKKTSLDDVTPHSEPHPANPPNLSTYSLTETFRSRSINPSASASPHELGSSHDARVSTLNEMASGKAGEGDALLKMLAETGRNANRRLARSGKLTLFISHGDLFVNCLPDTFLRVQVGGSSETTESPVSRLTNSSKRSTPASTPKIKPRSGIEVPAAQLSATSAGSHASFEWRFLCTCAVGNDLLPIRVSIHQANSIGQRHCICEGFFHIPKDESEGKDTLIMDTPSWQQAAQSRSTPFSIGTPQPAASLQGSVLSTSNQGQGGISLFGAPRKVQRRHVDSRAMHAAPASTLNGASNVNSSNSSSGGLGVIHFVWQLDDVRVVESSDNAMSDMMRESEHGGDSNEDSASAHSGETAGGYKSTPGISHDPTPGQVAHINDSTRPSLSSSINSSGVDLDAQDGGGRAKHKRITIGDCPSSPLSNQRFGSGRSRELSYGLVGSPTSSQGHRKNSYRLSTQSGRSNTQKSVRTNQSHGSTTASSVTVGALERLGCFLAAHPVRYVLLRVTVLNVELQYAPYSVTREGAGKTAAWYPRKLWFPMTQDVMCPDPAVHKALQKQQQQDNTGEKASWLPWRRQNLSGSSLVFQENILFKTLNRGEFGDQHRYSPPFDFAVASPMVQTSSHPVRATLDCDWSFCVSTTPSTPLKLSVWRKRHAGETESPPPPPPAPSAAAAAKTPAGAELEKAEARAILLRAETKDGDEDGVEDTDETGREYCGEVSLFFARELDEASFGAVHIRRFQLKMREKESISASQYSSLRLSDGATSEECIAYATLQYQWVSDTLSS